jgi:hypothetical protein
MQNYKVTDWFSVGDKVTPKYIGLYETIFAKPSDRKTNHKTQLRYWNGLEWKRPVTDSASEIYENQTVSHWRGVIAETTYPFEQIYAPVEPPELLNVRSMVHHSQWDAFHEDFELAATAKLVLAEVIEYTEELLGFIRPFEAADDIGCDLNELLNSLEDVASELEPSELDVPGDKLSEKARRMDEKEFVDSARMNVHHFYELIEIIEDNLPMPEEEEEYDPATLFMFNQVAVGLENIKRMVEVILEG